MIRCDHCGAVASVYAESCPTCSAFASLSEDGTTGPAQSSGMALGADEIGHRRERRLGTGFEPWDDALSGGLVVPQTAVIYGRPGSRKSSYAGAIAWNIGGEDALYLCSEMPTDQIRDVVRRGFPEVGIRFAGNDRGATEWRKCEAEVQRQKPPIVVYDSIQQFEVPDMPVMSDTAIGYVVKRIIRMCADLRHIAILISQVNAEGRPRCAMSIIHLCGSEVQLTPKMIRVGKSWFGQSREVVLCPEDVSPELG